MTYLRVYDGTQLVDRVVQTHVVELFADHRKHPLHALARPEVLSPRHVLKPRHKRRVVQRTVPDGSADGVFLFAMLALRADGRAERQAGSRRVGRLDAERLQGHRVTADAVVHHRQLVEWVRTRDREHLVVKHFRLFLMKIAV